MDPVLLGEILAGIMFLGTILAVMLGYPVAFTLAAVGLMFASLGILFGIFDDTLLRGIPSRYFDNVMTNEVLVAVPLFVFMGVMLERSRIAEELLETMGLLFGSLRGGLGISVILVGALLAASTGIVGATVVTMGLLSLPAMTRAGYDPKLASGVICASGTLGQIIPPSTVLIFMGDILASANQRAQMEMGNFAAEALSVGQLFAGALIPGLVLVGLYVGWVVFRAILQPESCPPVAAPEGETRRLATRVLVALVPPVLLIIGVLGSILSGIATPTESAAVGAIGAMLLATLRMDTRRWFVPVTGFLALVLMVVLSQIADLRLSRPEIPAADMPYLVAALVAAAVFTAALLYCLLRLLGNGVLRSVMDSTVRISSMVFVILIGASVFSLVFRGLGGEHVVSDVLSAVPGGQIGAVLAVMLLMFFLGFFLDTFEIIFIVVPITAPALIKLGVDPIWLGVMIGVNLQTSFLTPPFGFALFYLRGVASAAIKTAQIYRGAFPFVGLQVAGLVLLWVFPAMATWLPDRVFGEPPVAIAPAGAPGEPANAPAAPAPDLFGTPSEPSPAPSRPQPGSDLFGN